MPFNADWFAVPWELVESPSSEIAPFSHRAIDSIMIETTTPRIIVNHQYHHHRQWQSSSVLLANNNNNSNDGNNNNKLWDGIVGLWDEIIEMSTYGPSERKMLKVQRERQLDDMNLLNPGEQQAGSVDNDKNMDDDRAWMDAFSSAKDNTATNDSIMIDNNDDDDERKPSTMDFDGYAMQDLLLSKWGVPLDIDFQRFGTNIYCTILPQVGYGGSALKSRFDTELNYLMHLQGVAEVLHKYDNLEGFVEFVEGTKKRPKSGTDSVPFRLDLTEDDVDRIIPK